MNPVEMILWSIGGAAGVIGILYLFYLVADSMKEDCADDS